MPPPPKKKILGFKRVDHERPGREMDRDVLQANAAKDKMHGLIRN
jgi:hypothetical protein